MRTILLLLLLFPLLGGLHHVLLGRRVSRRQVEIVACASIMASFAMAAIALLMAWRQSHRVVFFHWFTVADFSAAMDVLYDPLSGIMAVMVTFVSSLIHLYSIGYMRDEEGYVRYFCYLNLFVFSMLVITLADNLVFLFLGWEGVGFCSYALIGFWFRDVANASAGRKAFLLTRIGDVAFGVVIGLCFVTFNTLSIAAINARVAEVAVGTATLLGLLLLWSAVGKSAQLPLVVWLPDAMAGPTPVSALIHAATMVTAGVYLLIRLFPVVAASPTTLTTVAAVGAGTALYAACSALGQTEIKRVLAYSTISQVGYMFFAVGVGDIIGGMAFLLSHAFYKALLFLAAGCVIHALHDEQNIFRMGGYLRRRAPVLFWLFLAGVLALGAVPPFSGYVAKDRILLAAFTHPEAAYKLLWAVGTLTAFLTTLYSFRLFFIVFTGEPAEPFQREVHRLPSVMMWTLWPLAFLALFGGVMNLPPIWADSEWLAHSLASIPGARAELGASKALEWRIAGLDGALSLKGLVLGFLL